MGQLDKEKLRELVGLELIRIVDLINAKVTEYAHAIGEERPLTICLSSRTQEPYIDIDAYVDLGYLERQGMTMEEAHKVPYLLETNRLSNGEIRHRFFNRKYLGEDEEGGENNG